LIVPVEEVSDKQEYSARTFRSRINRKLDKYLKPSRLSKIKKSSLNMKFDGLDLDNIEKIIDDLKISKNVNRTNFFNGGTKQAKSRLRSFLKDKIKDYADKSNDPAENCVSDLSPYLHFGQISPLYIALQSQKKKGEGVEAFCEQLIVRRELSHNFVYYNDNYDNYKGLPSWSRRTLNYHTSDKRKYTYTFKQFENAETHDEYWNAAQKQMMITAKMHGYMRMYWGKKILEWTEKPADAVDIALKLNNKYELDGRDPNGYTGVLWCFGLHDHPWAEREIFGKVRYMNAKGLKRKFNIDDYIEKIRKIG
jgi:deoxyribodipyrimidine photo-lyase